MKIFRLITVQPGPNPPLNDAMTHLAGMNGYQPGRMAGPVLRLKLKTPRHRLLHLCIFLLLLTFAACQETAIVHDLIERDANEILVILAKNGITAKKEKVEKNQEVTWFISVDPDDDMSARSILVSNNLPKIRHGGLSGICKDAGLILTPKTEKCREILASKGEIINSLESIPGVVSADVVLNIPDKEEFPDENSPTPRPTASVTVQYLKDKEITTTLTEGKVQEFVANSVNGLDARDVAVILTFINTGLEEPGKTTGTQTDTLADTHGVSPVITPTQPVIAQTDSEETATDTAQATLVDGDTVEQELAMIGGLKMDTASAHKFKVVAVLFLSLFLLITVALIFVLLRMARVKKQAVGAALQTVDETEDEAERKLLKA